MLQRKVLEGGSRLLSHEPDLPLCEACHNQFMDRFFSVTIKAFLLRLNEHEASHRLTNETKNSQKYHTNENCHHTFS